MKSARPFLLRPLRTLFSAFTLVELIVVITILAILATVGFLTLSGYTDDARSATVAANVRTVYSAILTESTTSGNSPRYYVDHDPAAALSGGIVFVDGTPVTLTGGQWGSGGTNYSAGNPRWDRLRMNGDKFRLSAVLRGGLAGPNGFGGLPGSAAFGGLAELAGAAYDTGAISVGAFDYVGKAGLNGRARTATYFQVAGVSPGTKKATVTGNYAAVWTGAVLGLVKDPAQSSLTGAVKEGSVVDPSSFVSWTCSGLPANAAYFWGATSYSLSVAPLGTSLLASYAPAPASNTCQFSCASGTWDGSSCAVSCPSGASCSGNATEFSSVGTFTFVPSVSGTYRLEAYGSQGGNMGSYQGGAGGYAYGDATLTAGVTYYVNVGGVGTNGGVAGYGGGASGGGGTDLRTSSSDLNTRMIVGGGGGGAGGYSFGGGVGGGLTGGKGLGDDGGNGGTQTAGGAAGAYGSNPGTFGVGGTCNWMNENCGGGGGGYYGGAGGSGSGNNGGGGGGSGYVGSLANSGMQTGVRTGNGLLRITKL